MKGSDIADALSVNPLAEFAMNPRSSDVKVVRVRGLTKADIPGTWYYAESTDPMHGTWRKVKLEDRGIAYDVLASRDLCTVEDAERVVKERIEKNAAQFAANAKLDRIVDTLHGHGVEARRALGGILIRDTVELGRLLARLP